MLLQFTQNLPSSWGMVHCQGMASARSETHDAGRNPRTNRLCLDCTACLGFGLHIERARDMHTVDRKLTRPFGLVISRCSPSGKQKWQGCVHTCVFCKVHELPDLVPPLHHFIALLKSLGICIATKLASYHGSRRRPPLPGSACLQDKP